MTGNGEVMKRRVKEGTGQFPMDCPIQDSRLTVHYRYNMFRCINMNRPSAECCVCKIPCCNASALGLYTPLSINSAEFHVCLDWKVIIGFTVNDSRRSGWFCCTELPMTQNLVPSLLPSTFLQPHLALVAESALTIS